MYALNPVCASCGKKEVAAIREDDDAQFYLCRKCNLSYQRSLEPNDGDFLSVGGWLIDQVDNPKKKYV